MPTSPNASTNASAREPEWEPLWPGGAPLAHGAAAADVPAVRHFRPAVPNGRAMVILPGGGYEMLAAHEGEGYAVWLAGLGYHAFEVRYRLAPHGYRHPAMWMDATRAMRLVRSRAAGLEFDPAAVGIIGSSAGGHLAAHAAVCHDGGDDAASDPVDRWSSRPALAVLCYPVITMSGPPAHGGSRENLLGPDAPAALRDEVSVEKRVTPATPPCFLWHTVEDSLVEVENVLLFSAELRRAAVAFELHLYQHGPHGLGLAGGHPWTVECERWLAGTFAAQRDTVSR